MEEVINKVRNLLNMTVENGCSQAEAENASRFAQVLLSRHRLSMADLEEKVEGFIVNEDPLADGNRIAKWKVQLAVAVASNNGCKIITRNGGLHSNGGMRRTREKKVLIIGKESDAEVVRRFYMHLSELIEVVCKDANKKGLIRGKDGASSFKLGMVHSIASRLSEGRQEAAKEASTSALVKVNNSDKELARWVSDNLNLKKAPSTATKVRPDAYTHGVIAGKNANLSSKSLK